jgi:uncharacterized protein YbjT (DUF2867 family)
LTTAFVTGATGCLGTNLVGQLVAEGWHVVAMHRGTSRLDDLGTSQDIADTCLWGSCGFRVVTVLVLCG